MLSVRLTLHQLQLHLLKPGVRSACQLLLQNLEEAKYLYSTDWKKRMLSTQSCSGQTSAADKETNAANVETAGQKETEQHLTARDTFSATTSQGHSLQASLQQMTTDTAATNACCDACTSTSAPGGQETFFGRAKESSGWSFSLLHSAVHVKGTWWPHDILQPQMLP